MDSKISVIMPCYNSDKYIAKAIESILKQTYPNWELIIVDDASTDKSLEVINKYMQIDPRIKVFANQENKGVGAARNLAISHSTGEYIAFLDADDIANAKRLEREVEFLDKNKMYGAVGTQALLIDPDDHIVGKVKCPSAWSDIKKCIFFRCPFVNSSMMVRRCILDKYGIYVDETINYGEDYLLWINLSNHCKMHNLKSCLTLYRTNTTGLSYQWITKMGFEGKCSKEHFKIFHVLWEREKIGTGSYNIDSLINALTGKDIKNFFEFFINVKNVIKYGLNICKYKYDRFIFDEIFLCICKMYKSLIKQYKSLWYQFLEMRECVNRYGSYPYPKYMVLPDKKLIYLEMPKVANCSIKASMLKKKFKDDYSVQKESLKYTMHSLDKVFDDYFKFTFVRNPFERVVSCYESKYHKDRQMLGNIMTELEYDNYLFGFIRNDRGFANFLCRIALIPDRYKDHHFKPQYAIVYDKNGNQRVNYIGRYEDLSEEYGKIVSQYELDELMLYNKTEHKNYMDYYNWFTVRLAYFIYKKDIEKFGYKSEYKKIKKYVQTKNSK